MWVSAHRVRSAGRSLRRRSTRSRRAARGLRYNEFHTVAMCSSTRAALLTGRNHHPVGYGAISNVSLDEPGLQFRQPIDGTSMIYTFDDAGAPTRHSEQYFEMLGNRSYYKNGWMASTTPAAGPWKFTDADPRSFKWELYDLNKDYSQSHNVAAQFPAKLVELQRDFEKAAKRFNVYPLSSDLMGRSIRKELRPSIIGATGSFTYYPGETRYPVNAWPALAPGWAAKAVVTTESGRENRPILAQGKRFGGLSLKLDRGVPVFEYDPTGRAKEHVAVYASPMRPGRHEIAVSFTRSRAPYRLTLAVDGHERDGVTVERLTTIRGEAFVGCPMLDDAEPTQLCGCAIEKVTISN
jgi:arylsulfatase